MSTEETPLLASETIVKHHDVYLRFSQPRKLAILIMVSGCGLLPFFVMGTFTPSIPVIAEDLNTTGRIVNLAVSLSVLAASLGGLMGAAYSTFYGRRPVYLCILPILIFGSFGVSGARTVGSLFLWRFLQSMGAAPNLVIGAGVIGDIYKLEERGRAMGFFFAACLIGPSIAPVIGGSVTHYFSWRAMQAAIGFSGVLILILLYVAFPETSQPGARGIEKMKINASTPIPRFTFVNPFRPILLLRSPNSMIIAMATTAALFVCFVLLNPLAYTVGIRYNLSNSTSVGACFLPSGLGCMTGAIFIGRISDMTVIKWRQKRGGVWYPEDRLRASLVALSTVIPLSLIGFALANRYVEGNLGLTLCLICLFTNGMGVEIALGPSAAYLIDVMHSRSAESLAANNALRSLLIAVGIGLIFPSIETYGIVFTNALAAVLVWIAYLALRYLIKNGDRLRASVDVGFSATDSN